MKKLLVLSKYGMRAASTRYRFTQYFPALRAAGFEPVLSPLLDDSHLAAHYAGRLDPRPLARAILRRGLDLLRAGGFEAALLNYEAFPYLPPFYERLLALRIPFLFDIDDAIFHRYDLSPKLRPFLGDKIATVAALSRVAIAGNEYLAANLRKRARDVRVIPTVVDTDSYRPLSAASGEKVVIGWIGSPSTALYLAGVAPALRELSENGKARVVLVGAGKNFQIDVPGVELRDWAEEREVADVQSFDIGIMPLPDDPWARGKCGFKLIQYMACAKSVVASPVGVNEQIVGAGGLLARDPAEWKTALTKLVESAALRSELGAAGRARAEAEYSLARWSGSFVQAVKQAAR
ncbi:MAG: glycosyltransferase family 4 protein [Bdellovibrionota bacterium]